MLHPLAASSLDIFDVQLRDISGGDRGVGFGQFMADTIIDE